MKIKCNCFWQVVTVLMHAQRGCKAIDMQAVTLIKSQISHSLKIVGSIWYSTNA